MRRVDVSCRSPCMAFLPPSGGVFRLSFSGSSPGIPCRRSFGFQGSTSKTATKKPSQNRPALPSLFLEGHASRLCNGWKAKMFSPAGSERICKNMLYSIVGIDYHKNRVVSTKTFENTLLSAACKKKKGELWQKERGLDGASPLDKFFKSETGYRTMLSNRFCKRSNVSSSTVRKVRTSDR